MRAEREVEGETPEAGVGDVRRDVAPEVGIDEDSVDEDDGPPLAPVEVADVTVAERHVLFLAECW